ncbi:MAG TPA: response regulator transcription factor [Dinghuibacter sp.]|uniref:response regulator transcription factor n=1 Tax=Dinghuibacter sp. TaxID=2024697 RepID=UPI002BBE1A45|nr:response regulator transcription factor [Dinghuibacter sp.]HTJ11527.1 response regulator transcription factor [Dinghuibacter sp.]
MKLLIVEDEPGLLDSMTAYLSLEDYTCESAMTYAEALEKIDLYAYDCILLDIMLPGGDGLALLRELKTNRKTEGVLIISAKNKLEDKITGLQMGADDYLAKPFHLPELGARVAAIIRRKQFGGNNLLEYQEIQVDTQGRTVKVSGTPVTLTKKEYALLVYLLSNRNKVISKSALAEHLWGDNMDMVDNYDFIYTHVKNLRKKLLDAGAGDYLQSVYGVGYKWTTP